MQMDGFGVEIIFGEASPLIFPIIATPRKPYNSVRIQSSFFGSLPSCAELLRLLFQKLVSRMRCSQLNPVNTVGYRGDADSLFPSWCTTILITLKQLLRWSGIPGYCRAMSEGCAPLVQWLGCQRRSGSRGSTELSRIISRAQILESRCSWMVLV